MKFKKYSLGVRWLLSLITIFGTFACTDHSQVEMDRIDQAIPSRSGRALTGPAFVKEARRKSKAGREQFIYEQAIAGNIPNFMRRLKKIPLRTKLKNGRWLSGSIMVTRDYFSIGDDRNFVRVPMNPITAQRIANRLGFMLPTTKIVDEIYKKAEIKLSPKPLPPGKQMTTVDYFARHNRMVESQLNAQKYRMLTAGHKKDIVLTNKLLARPNRVAIYGWHRKSGVPIQPLSLVHDDKYADYSHGVRFVWKVMEVGGKRYNVADVLRHKVWSQLISKEGPIRQSRLKISEIQDEKFVEYSRFDDLFGIGNLSW